MVALSQSRRLRRSSLSSTAISRKSKPSSLVQASFSSHLKWLGSAFHISQRGGAVNVDTCCLLLWPKRSFCSRRAAAVCWPSAPANARPAIKVLFLSLQTGKYLLVRCRRLSKAQCLAKRAGAFCRFRPLSDQSLPMPHRVSGGKWRVMPKSTHALASCIVQLP